MKPFGCLAKAYFFDVFVFSRKIRLRRKCAFVNGRKFWGIG